MKKQFLRIIRDNIPEPLNYIVAPVLRNKLLHNKEFCRYYELLNNRESLGQEKIREYQFNQLKQILKDSYENVPYYTDLFNKVSFDPYKFSDFDQITKIPVLTRESVAENFNKLTSRKKIDYYTGTTGASTGLPLKFLLDYDSIYKENAFIYHFRNRLGYKFSDKIVTFRNQGPSNFLWKLNPMYGEVVFSNTKLSKNTVKRYIEKINRLKPRYINGYISAIWYFAKLLEQNSVNLDFRLDGIFFISEGIDPEQRAFIEKFFNVKSLAFYGHSERAVIAEEIKPYQYTFDPFYGYTEQIPLNATEYEIVGTGFLNRIMPLIRYNTKDVCSFENNFFNIYGKRNSKLGLYGVNKEFITATGFYLEGDIFKNIITYQFMQKQHGKADMFLIVNDNFQENDLKIIKKFIDSQFIGVLTMDIKIVEKMILTPRGKFQRYITNITE